MLNTRYFSLDLPMARQPAMGLFSELSTKLSLKQRKASNV